MSEPIYAVIFSSQHSPSVRTDERAAAHYEKVANEMFELAARQPGFVAVESARGTDGFGITVSYWSSREAIVRWKAESEHLVAQRLGRDVFYERYRVRICTVEREYEFALGQSKT